MGQRVVISQIGSDPMSAIESFASIESMERPEAAASDVVIAVKSASVGWVDLIMAAGQYQHVPKPPYTPGLEYAGVVEAVGSEVKNVAVGDRVLVDPFLAGPRSAGAHQRYGGFATWAVAPASAVHRVPGALDFDQACNLLGNYETAWHCLIKRGRLKAGETVLVHGASGSTGMAAVYIAKIVGATVIATGRSAAKLEVVKAQGADHVIVVGEPEKLREQVRPLTRDGKGVDVVYDGVGGEIGAASMRCVAFGARFLIVGWASTPGNAKPLPTNLIMMKGVDVLGCPTVISTINDPSIRAERFGQVMEWAASGKITPLVSAVYPLTDFKAAMTAKWNGAVVGGCVVHP